MADPELHSAQWKRFRRAFIAYAVPVCGICGEWVDKSLRGTDRLGPTVDHILPRSRGGSEFDLTNCQLAHQHCNAKKRNDVEMSNVREW